MALFTNVNGTKNEITSLFSGINGTKMTINHIPVGINGTLYKIIIGQHIANITLVWQNTFGETSHTRLSEVIIDNISYSIYNPNVETTIINIPVGTEIIVNLTNPYGGEDYGGAYLYLNNEQIDSYKGSSTPSVSTSIIQVNGDIEILFSMAPSTNEPGWIRQEIHITGDAVNVTPEEEE